MLAPPKIDCDSRQPRCRSVVEIHFVIKLTRKVIYAGGTAIGIFPCDKLSSLDDILRFRNC